MSVDIMIQNRTEQKELRMNEGYILRKSDVVEKDWKYFQSLWCAKQEGFYSIRECEKFGQPVTEEELQEIPAYAMCRSFRTENLPYDGNTHKRYCPCIPVFYRESKSTHQKEPHNHEIEQLKFENAQLRGVIEQMDPEFFNRKCRVCGCDWNHPCLGGCWWVEDDLCSSCAEEL